MLPELARAANDGDASKVRRLAESPPQPELDLALARAAMKSHFEIANLLIDAGADPNGEYGDDYGPILLASCEALNPEGVRYLVDAGANAETPLDRQTKYPDHNTPMRMALGSYVRGRPADRAAIVRSLERAGASRPPEVTTNAMAVFLDEPQALDRGAPRERLERMPHANVSLDGGTLLHLAAEVESHGCLVELLERGADIEARTAHGTTPIFHTILVGSGESEGLAKLIEAGASREVRANVFCWNEDRGEHTPLSWARHAQELDGGIWRPHPSTLQALGES